MSMLLMVKAMQIKVGSAQRKLVLIKLADNANDQGECWPSYKHIADHCEMDRRTVMRHVKKLAEVGILRIEHRKGQKGNSSNIFHLRIPSDPLSLGSGDMSLGGDTGSLTPSDPVSPRTSHSLEPVSEPLLRDSRFSEFWNLYGKKVDSKKCEAKFNKLSKKDIELIFEKLPAYVKSTPDKQYRKNPLTWLNGKCWNDEVQQRMDLDGDPLSLGNSGDWHLEPNNLPDY